MARNSGLHLPETQHGRRHTNNPTLSAPAVNHSFGQSIPRVSSSQSVPRAGAPSMPPGAVGDTSSVSAAPSYVSRTEDALLRAPSRRNQKHLHPKKLNGALWFGVDPEVHAFMRATWQGNYWGPWQSWKHVPDEKKDNWWHSFIQNYYWDDEFHDEVYAKWKLQTQVTICGCISSKKRKGKQPKYISDTDWTYLSENWATPEAQAKSQSAAGSRVSAPPGKKMHKHSAGPRTFTKIEYDTMNEEDFDEPISYTNLVRKTPPRKDGTFIDERAESLVLEVEQAVDELLTQNGSPQSNSHTASTEVTSTSRRVLLNQEYIKRAQTKKGTIYGLGSVQYKDPIPSHPARVSLKRSLDLEMRLTGVETTAAEVKADLSAFKADFKQEMAETRSSLNMILQALQPQPSAPATTAPTTIHVSETHAQPQASRQAPPPHPTTTQQSDLDRWCANELGL